MTALVAVSEGMQAGKFCSSKILQLWTGLAANVGWPL